MNELTLDGKIYISSKRAAEITGYAKDYVGQLCREGRVEARLVGRNWYVLKDAIESRNFEEPKRAEKAIEAPQENAPEEPQESPRYEAEDHPSFPVVENLVETRQNNEETHDENDGQNSQPNEAWAQWFALEPQIAAPMAEAAQEPMIDTELPAQSEEEPVAPEPEALQEPAQEVSLRRIREYTAKNTPQISAAEPLVEQPVITIRTYRRGKKWLYPSVQAACIVVALIAVAAAAIGTGFLAIPGLKAETDLLAGVAAYAKVQPN